MSMLLVEGLRIIDVCDHMEKMSDYLTWSCRICLNQSQGRLIWLPFVKTYMVGDLHRAFAKPCLQHQLKNLCHKMRLLYWSDTCPGMSIRIAHACCLMLLVQHDRLLREDSAYPMHKGYISSVNCSATSIHLQIISTHSTLNALQSSQRWIPISAIIWLYLLVHTIQPGSTKQSSHTPQLSWLPQSLVMARNVSSSMTTILWYWPAAQCESIQTFHNLFLPIWDSAKQWQSPRLCFWRILPRRPTYTPCSLACAKILETS